MLDHLDYHAQVLSLPFLDEMFGIGIEEKQLLIHISLERGVLPKNTRFAGLPVWEVFAMQSKYTQWLMQRRDIMMDNDKWEPVKRCHDLVGTADDPDRLLELMEVVSLMAHRLVPLGEEFSHLEREEMVDIMWTEAAQGAFNTSKIHNLIFLDFGYSFLYKEPKPKMSMTGYTGSGSQTTKSGVSAQKKKGSAGLQNVNVVQPTSDTVKGKSQGKVGRKPDLNALRPLPVRNLANNLLLSIILLIEVVVSLLQWVIQLLKSCREEYRQGDDSSTNNR